jgi:hypothetical protein
MKEDSSLKAGEGKTCHTGEQQYEDQQASHQNRGNWNKKNFCHTEF